jgi:hypothetical protein
MKYFIVSRKPLICIDAQENESRFRIQLTGLLYDHSLKAGFATAAAQMLNGPFIANCITYGKSTNLARTKATFYTVGGDL